MKGARSSVRIEQWFPKPRAGGSSPLGRTIVIDRGSGKCVVRHVIASPKRVGYVGWGVWDAERPTPNVERNKCGVRNSQWQ